MKRLARLIVVVVGLSVLAPVLPRAAEAQKLVSIIHNGRTIMVAPFAVPWHLLHGDTLADPSCVPPCEG